ncbi:MAG: alpha-L-rhamnosidase N-terminal domain-containing protein, partial [Cyclobacteriaceae bacterium]|nr:alpha-L-rhamnosidase N-terminal domain-containing protein [Cyclobacteriaceae bacterium]
MQRFLLLLGASILLINCTNTKQTNDSVNPWTNARWIALEQLEDDMKVVPAVHGSGDKLGDRCIKRSIVPMFRKEFNAAKNIENAIINICGLGHYELTINGEKIGDRFLSPGWSYYQKRYLYNTFNITEQIKNGDKAIGIIVGTGFYNINRERYRKLVVAYG